MNSPDLTLMSSSVCSFEILAANTHKGTAVLKLAEILINVINLKHEPSFSFRTHRVPWKAQN